MSIWETQQLHNDATQALARRHDAATARHALVTISAEGQTKAVLMVKRNDWQIEDIYTADHETPGAVGVVVIGIW